MSNFKGKRMVSEDLIKKLETLEPGGGTEYTAGVGIDISAQNEISIDTDTVAIKSELFSGSYNDLTDKPDLSIYAESANLATVATTGAYSDLSGTPTLATVATTGDYDDLLNKPTIPAAQVNSDWNASSGVAEILNKPALATVATTGAYSDLSGTPTIPAAVSGTNDGTNWTSLTIGSDTYDIPAGGSGSSYTFTNGLTESSGTVSWNLNNRIKVNSNNSLYINTAADYPLTNNSSSSNGIAIGYSVNSNENIPSNSVGLYLIGNTKFSQNKKYTNNFTLGLANELYSTSSSSTQNVRGQFILGYQNKITSNHEAISNTEGSFSIGSNNNITQNNYGAIFEYGHHLDATSSNNGSKIILGTYNDDGEYLFQLGNGTANNAKSNALTVAWDGTIVSKNLPAVSGTDGTYQLTATTSSGTTTYSWAAGGSGGKYLHKVKIYANFGGTQAYWTEDFISSSATAYTSVSDYLTDRGYTVTGVSDQPTKSLDTYATSTITSLAYRDTVGYVTSQITINSSGVVTYGSWATQSNTPVIQDEVIAL